MEHLSNVLTQVRQIEPEELALPVCPDCNGEGCTICPGCNGVGGSSDDERVCSYCYGDGVIEMDQCKTCEGERVPMCECGVLPVCCHIETIFGRRAVCDECSAAPVDLEHEVRRLVGLRDHYQQLYRDNHRRWQREADRVRNELMGAYRLIRQLRREAA